MPDLLPWSISWVVAYLIGSIPFGFIIARSRGVDIRQHGSGNIGATNVGRVLGRRLGLICFGLDVLKGLLPTLAAGIALVDLASFPPTAEHSLSWLGVAAMTIAGHMFPVWLGFKGGKGVATGFGALLGVYPILSIAAAASLLVWLASVKLTRYVGVSSCAAALLMPILTLSAGYGLLTVQGKPDSGETTATVPTEPASWTLLQATMALWPYLAVTLALAALVIYRHRGNIRRTIAGTESRIGQRVPPVAESDSPKN